MAPLALTAHVFAGVVSESGAPRLAVISVHQRAARVLLVLVDEGKDAGRAGAGPSHCDAAGGRLLDIDVDTTLGSTDPPSVGSFLLDGRLQPAVSFACPASLPLVTEVIAA